MVWNFTLFFFCSSLFLRLGSDRAELDLALNGLSTSKNLSKYLLDILPFFLKIGRRSTVETFKLFVCTFILGSIWNAYAHFSNFLGSELKALKSQIFSGSFRGTQMNSWLKKSRMDARRPPCMHVYKMSIMRPFEKYFPPTECQQSRPRRLRD